MITLKTRDWRVIRFPRPLWTEEEEQQSLSRPGTTRSSRSMSRDSGADRAAHYRSGSSSARSSGSSRQSEMDEFASGSPKRRQGLATPRELSSSSASPRSDRRMLSSLSPYSTPSSSPYSSYSSGSLSSGERRRLEELERLFDRDGNVGWNEFYRELQARSPWLQDQGRDGASEDLQWVVKIMLGGHINDRLHISKYRLITSFFGSLANESNLRAMLAFYRDKVSGKSDYTIDKKIGWFQGVLLPPEEEDLLVSVAPQTFIVTFGTEESTIVFAYNDYDDEDKRSTSTFLISFVYDRMSNKFTGMDMEDPDSDKDVEYATLFEIVSAFKKLGFRPLSSHILFGHQ